MPKQTNKEIIEVPGYSTYTTPVFTFCPTIRIINETKYKLIIQYEGDTIRIKENKDAPTSR